MGVCDTAVILALFSGSPIVGVSSFSMPAEGFHRARRSNRLWAAKRPRVEESPLVRIGLIADIQYAPIPDGASFSGNPRYYQHSLDVTRAASKHFEKEGVDLVVNLGDIVDGKCQDVEKWGGKPFDDGVDPGMTCMKRVMKALSLYKRGPILHAYGNHCLYNLSRKELGENLKIPFVEEPCGDLVGYYSYLCKGESPIRLIVLDSYDVAQMQRCSESSQKHKLASKILEEHNPNYPANENSPEGLIGVGKRFVAFNGGIGEVQIQWLAKALHTSREQGERVIILSHQPIHPESSNPVCLIWNYKEVLDVLRQYPDVVLASFAGHAHKGGYSRDAKSGIHFRVVEAALETPAPETTYATINVYGDRLEIEGKGDCESATYIMDHQPLPDLNQGEVSVA